MSKLRGGGCGSSHNVANPFSPYDNPMRKEERILKLPTNLKANIKLNVQKIILNENDDTIRNGFQYFFLNEHAFQMMNENMEIASQYVDVLTDHAADLLGACVNLVKSKGIFCHQAIQIAHWMAKVLLGYHTNDDEKKRKIDQEKVTMFLTKVKSIEDQLDVEKILHDTAIRYELYCIKIIFTIFPTDSQEAKNLGIQFLQGVIESVLTMSPTDNLYDSIKGGIKLAMDEGYQLYCKNQYLKILRIEQMKCDMICDMRDNSNFQMTTYVKKLGELYQQIQSSSWEIKYAWIKAITDIISAKPIQSKKDLQFSEKQIKELKAQNLIIMIDSENLMFPLNADKLMQLESKDLSNKIPMIKTLKEVQSQLIIGNKWLPRFIDYGIKSNDQPQQQKLLTPKSYFRSLFKSIGFQDYIRDLEEINKKLKTLQSYSYDFIKEFDGHWVYALEHQLSLFQEEVRNITDKTLKFSQQQFKLKWISLQWDQYVIKYFDIDKLQKEPNDFNVQVETYEFDEYPRQADQKYLEEFNIYIYLKQLSRIAELHQRNIKNLQKITIYTDFFFNIINTESQYDKVTDIIKIIQKSVMELLQQLFIYPKKQIEILESKLSDFNYDSLNMDQSKFLIPSNDILSLYLVTEYDKQMRSELNVMIELYQKTREQFYNDQSQDTTILAIYLSKMKKDLENLTIQMSSQETLRNRIIQLYKSVQFSEQREAGRLLEAQSLFYKSLPYTEKIIVDNHLSESIQRSIVLAKEWDKQCKNIYSERLVVNPYDQESAQELDRVNKKIVGIIKDLNLVLDIIKLGLENSTEYIKQIIEKLRQNHKQANNIIEPKKDKVREKEQKQELSPSQQYEGDIKKYEDTFKKLKPQLQECFVQVEEIATNLEILKRIQETCERDNLPSNWLNKIKQFKLNGLSDLSEASISLKHIKSIRLNTDIATELIDTIFPQDSSQTLKEKILSYFNIERTRVKECVITSLFTIIESCLVPNIKVEANLMVLRMKTFEIDKRICTLLKSEQYRQEMRSILEKHWPNESEKVLLEVRKGLKDLSTIQYEIQQETDIEKRKTLKSNYRIRENEIQEQLDNISDIGNILSITVLFIKDIKNDLIRMEEKINQIQENVKIMTNDLSYLKGKTVYQLLDVRRQNIIIKKKMIDAQKVYIQINCISKKYNRRLEQEQEQNQTDNEEKNKRKFDQEGQESLHTELMSKVQKFFNDKKAKNTSLLLHGQAGSGKSTASRKIEEYLWEVYQKTSDKDCKIVPILIQLPQLQDPIRQAMTETLKSDSYRFSDNQIRDLKEEIAQKKIKLVIIMDSYDELAEEWRGTNLIVSNKLSMWGSAQFENYPKVISTTRSEALSSADYKENFLPEQLRSIKPSEQYKEIKILKFNTNQQIEYIEKYLIISIKRILYETYIQMTKKENELEVFEQFILFWDNLKLNINQYEINELLTPAAIKQLQNSLIEDKNVQISSQELLRNMEVLLSDLKSKFFYSETIKIMKLENILETPFMMELVVEVLPSLIKTKSQLPQVKRFFIPKYEELILSQNSESQSIAAYKAQQAWDDLVSNHKFFETFLITQDVKEIEKNLQENVRNIDKDKKKKTDLYLVALKSRTLSQYDFYQSFLSLFFQKTISKQKENGFARSSTLLLNEVWTFAKNLAVSMSCNKKTQVEYQVRGLLYEKQTKSWEDEYFDDDKEKGEYKKLFRDCIPLRQQNNSYSFNHKSLQEFLVAKEFIKQMRDIRKEIQEEHMQNEHMTEQQIESLTYIKLKQLKNHFVNKQSWSKPFMNGTCAFIIQKGIRKPELRKIMYYAVQLTRADHDKEGDMKFLGSNCLFLLVNMGENFMGIKQLEDIRIKEIDLSGANFAYCNLNKSQFTDVNISGINLFNANLNNINWQNIKVGLYPNINLNTIQVQKMLYTDTNHLIIAGRDKIYHCCDNITPLIDSAQGCKLHYFQNIIFAQEARMIKCLDASSITNILLTKQAPSAETIKCLEYNTLKTLNNGQNNSVESAPKIEIKRVRFLEDELYYLTTEFIIYRCNIKDLKNLNPTPLKFHIDPNKDFKIDNFWFSDKNIMVSTEMHFYKLDQKTTSQDEFDVKVVKEFTGRCKYYPKYRSLKTSTKIELIDLAEQSDKKYEQDELENNRKQLQYVPKVNLIAELQNRNVNYKTGEEQNNVLIAKIENNKKAEIQQALILKRKEDNQPITQLTGDLLKIISFNSNTESFILWSSNEIQSYSVTVAYKKQATGRHNLKKIEKKIVSSNNKILVTVHQGKVVIWDIDRLENIYQLELNDIQCCVIDKNDMLTMYKGGKGGSQTSSNSLIQKDLRSYTQSMQLQFRRLVCTPYSQNFIVETIDGNIYFYQQKAREFNSSLISGQGSQYLQIGTQGQRLLILRKNDIQLLFWDSKTKEFYSKNGQNYYYAFADKDIKFRYEINRYEIYFMKGNQLYKVENNEASIISPAAERILKKKKLEKLSRVQDQKCIIVQSMVVTRASLYILIDAQLYVYALQKGIQQSVSKIKKNITYVLICNNKKQTIYYVINKNSICKDDQFTEPIYLTKEEIQDIIQLENENDLAIRHISRVRRLTIQSEFVEQKSFAIKNSKWLFYSTQQLFIAQDSKIYIYNLDLNTQIDIIEFNKGIPEKMCEYFNYGFVILCNKQIYLFENENNNKNLTCLEDYGSDCQDIYYTKDLLIIKCSRAIKQTVLERDGYLMDKLDIYFDEQWDHQQIVKVNNRTYIYGINNYQIVRCQIKQSHKSSQVMASLIDNYEAVRGFDLSHKYLVYYTKYHLYLQNLDQKNESAQIECPDGFKTIQICYNNALVLTSNLSNTIYIYSISEAFNSKDPKNQPQIIDEFKSIEKILWVQEQILILNDKQLFVYKLGNDGGPQKVASMKNGFKEISATETGFNILNKDHSIDIYKKQKYDDKIPGAEKIVQTEKYVRVQVFNPSSNQSINSINCSHIEAQIRTSNGFNLIGLLEENKDD